MKSILDRQAAPRSARIVSDLRTEVATTERELERLRTEWDALFAVCRRPSLCASYAWASAWWEAFGENPLGAGKRTALFVVVVRDAHGTVVGIAPFFEENPTNPFQVRRLRILGYLGAGEPFDMTEEPILLLRPGWEPIVLSEVAAVLRAHLDRGRWDAVCFRMHTENEGELAEAFRSLRGTSIVRFQVRSGSDYTELPESWSDYRKAMTKSMRDNLAYYPRLLTRDGHRWSVRILRDPDEMSAAVARLVELHRARARCERGALHDDHLHGAAQAAFLTRLLERTGADGNGFVAELSVEGETVASQAFVEWQDQLMVSYSGYREEWYRYSPVFVIDSIVFKDALERGVRRLDFLRNSAAWKTRWLARPGVPMGRVTAISRRPKSLLRYGLHSLRTTVRRNVVARVPILRRRWAKRTKAWQDRLAAIRVSSFCAMDRMSHQAGSALHWACAHHRTLLQISMHRHA